MRSRWLFIPKKDILERMVPKKKRKSSRYTSQICSRSGLRRGEQWAAYLSLYVHSLLNHEHKLWTGLCGGCGCWCWHVLKVHWNKTGGRRAAMRTYRWAMSLDLSINIKHIVLSVTEVSSCIKLQQRWMTKKKDVGVCQHKVFSNGTLFVACSPQLNDAYSGTVVRGIRLFNASKRR